MPASRSVQSLNVGIYGCTHAGKTRFLYQLLSDWKKAGRIVESSSVADAFLSAIDEEMRAYGRPQPTAVTTTGISLRVTRPDGGAWRVALRDLRGELLTGEIDDLSGVARRGLAPTQVRECDVFLFFFDPTSAEAPDRLDEHYRREATRAERFVEYVLDQRENRLLPIVFVQTRLDLWEANDAIGTRAAEWFREVLASTRRLYQERLVGHYPPSLVDPEKITTALSNVRAGEVERAILLASRLVDDARRFAISARRAVRGKALAGAAVASAFLAWLAYLAMGGGGATQSTSEQSPQSAPPATQRVSVYEWSPEDLVRQLDSLDRLLAAHPPDDRLPDLQDAQELNRSLQWMAAKIDQLHDDAVAADKGFSPMLRDRLHESWRKATAAIQNKCVSQVRLPVAQTIGEVRLSVLAAYLTGAAAPAARADELIAAQAAYWQVHRRKLVEFAGSAIFTHALAGSTSQSAIKELANILRTEEHAIRQTNIDCQPRDLLLSEVRLAARFCENRLDGWHPASWRVAAASAPADSRTKARRRLTFLASRQPPIDVELAPEPAPQPGRVRLAYDGQRRHVRLPLEEAPKVVLAIQSLERNAWEVEHEFDLTPTPAEHSLAVLGMPWLVRERGEVSVELTWQGYEFHMILSDLPEAPGLLWEIVERGSPSEAQTP